MNLPPSIPRAVDAERFRADPLAFLMQKRAELGDIFVLREEGPILSRAPDCRGVVAVFGTERQRAVLGDIDTYGMPPSAAKHLELNDALTNLNRSLHSMRGEEHASQKRVLSSIVDSAEVADVVLEWRDGETIRLLETMRDLTRRVATDFLFGERCDVAELLDAYFHLRREAATPGRTPDDDLRAALIATGEALDDALRRFIRASPSRGLIARMIAAGLTEDEIAGHANILFVSSSEPIAIALTWTLLILSQMPELRRSIRADATPLEPVISESLRLLPPNALMVRLTTRAAALCGVELPERCEIVLSPFVAHRDPSRFDDPNVFRPSRWSGERPSPYDYFPFGAGGHACVGRALALDLMKRILSAIVRRHDLVLAHDQEIDWRTHIQFMPREDPLVLVRAIDDRARGGALRGPVAALFSLDNKVTAGVESSHPN